jgi:hypothetical protein
MRQYERDLAIAWQLQRYPRRLALQSAVTVMSRSLGLFRRP